MILGGGPVSRGEFLSDSNQPTPLYGGSMSVVQVPMLAGAALRERARELNIPGRSRMSADELRAAIAEATTPRVRDESAREYHRELAAAIGAARPKGHPFRARNGKHKPSHVNRRFWR